MNQKTPSTKQNIVFTATVVCICAAIYFIAALVGASPGTDATPTIPYSPYKEHVFEHKFFTKLREQNFFILPIDESKHIYLLTKEDNPDAANAQYRLTLSVKEGCVTSFALEYPYCPVITLPEDPTKIELFLFDRQTQARKEQDVLIENFFHALISAFDWDANIPHATRLQWYNALLDVHAKSKSYKDTYQAFTFSAFLMNTADARMVFSLEQQPLA